LEEACYFLKELGMTFGEIARKLEIDEGTARKNYESYSEKIPEIDATDFETSRKFWADLVNEEEGNVRVTLVDQLGRFYHGRKLDLQKMKTEELVQILFANKEYLEKNPMGIFLSAKVPPGYDPTSPLKEIKKSIGMIEDILLERESKGKIKAKDKKRRRRRRRRR
jgi:hypothetical protein